MAFLGEWIRRWTVSKNNYNPDLLDDDTIDWVRAIPFILINLSCFLVFFVHFSWIAVATAAFLYFFRLFTIGAFYHRYFSHKTFKTNRFWQFIFAALAGTSVQRGPLWWAAHHRHHHMVSDQPEDAHSPVQHGFWWSHVGWFLTKKHYHYNPELVKDFRRYPEIVFLDRYDILMPTLLFLSLFIAGLMLQTYAPELNTGVGEMLVWGFSISLVALFNTTVIINSLCHIYGTRRFETSDNSKNNLLFALLTLGEGWHNNHHHYSASARQGFMWWEIDITYYLIKLMELLGIVWDVKPVPKSILEKRLIKEKNR
ncbi:MAG: acyl-CoA desaturase [Gammaproteobacteria bacterium]